LKDLVLLFSEAIDIATPVDDRKANQTAIACWHYPSKGTDIAQSASFDNGACGDLAGYHRSPAIASCYREEIGDRQLMRL
jgi:hypothetical protein